MMKERIYIFSSRFYEEEIANMDAKNLMYFDFLFDKDFLIIPKRNEHTQCWEIIVVCYHANVQKKVGKQKSCIVCWDVYEGNRKGKSNTNKNIRKWLSLQYKHVYDVDMDDADAVMDVFTSGTMKAYNSVKVPRLFDKRYNDESGLYQLLNFKYWGIDAGYLNTSSKKQIDRNWFGFTQVKEYKKKMIRHVDLLSKMQEKYL